MAYISTIPQATDKLKDSQPLILGNFAEIPTLIEVNHVGFVGGADDGKHIKVDFTESATHPVVAADEMLIYNFVNPTTTDTELYVKKTAALGVAGIPFTASSDVTDGWTYLPSGILIRWGTANGTGDFTITKVDAPQFTDIFNVQVTGRTDAAGDSNKALVLRTWSFVAATSFALNVSGVERLSAATAATTCHWMVIGV